MQVITDSPTVDDIQSWLTGQLSEKLAIEPGEIDLQAPFDSYGLDSMTAIALVEEGNKFLGLELSPLLIWHYPTIDALSEFLAEEVQTSDVETFEI